MAGKLGVVWLWHAEQPLGTPEQTAEQALHERYAPALDALAAAPTLRVGWHLGGPLATWLAGHDVEFVAGLRALVEARRVEMIGGGLGGPRLPEIPARDRSGQIRALRTHLEKTYGGRVAGAWCDRWESPAVTLAPLVDAGVEWTPAFGLGQEPVGPTPVGLLERGGRLLRVLQWHSRASLLATADEGPDGMLAELRQAADGGCRGAAVTVDLDRWSGETARRWVDGVVGADWVESLTPAEALGRWRADRPAKDIDLGMRDRTPARELLDARLRVVSERCGVLPPAQRGAIEARRHLYRAEGHLAPGADGWGRPHLRHALVASAMRAERIARQALGTETPALEVRHADLNADGRDEILIQTPALATVVVPHRGGHLAVLDDARADSDWLMPLRWDGERWPREAAVDRVLPPDIDGAALSTGDPIDESDLAQGVYAAQVAAAPDEARVVLARAGTWRRGYAGRPIRVEKELRCASGAASLTLRYRIVGGGDGTDDALFVSEWNCGLLEPGHAGRWLRGPDGARWGTGDTIVDHAAVLGVDCVDEPRGTVLSLRANRPVRLVTHPVEAMGGYQATAIALGVPIVLGGDAATEFTITATLESPD